MRKSDKKIIIINGTIDSIVQATIKKFSAIQPHIILWDSNETQGQLLVGNLKSLKYSVEFQKIDITNLPELEKKAKQVNDKFGRIDILINHGSFFQINATPDWSFLIEKSLTGVMNCIKAVSPYLLLNNSGRIINSTALLGLYGEINQANYSAVKNGVLGISKIWALELTKHAITVNTVAPGYIDNDYISKNTPMVLKSIKDKIPARKIGTAEDVANAYFFLASEDASYISGSVLNIDGGYAV